MPIKDNQAAQIKEEVLGLVGTLNPHQVLRLAAMAFGLGMIAAESLLNKREKALEEKFNGKNSR